MVDRAGDRFARDHHVVLVELGEEPGTGVESHLGFTLGLIGPVTVVTQVREDRTDIAVETDRPGQRWVSGLERRADAQRRDEEQ